MRRNQFKILEVWDLNHNTGQNQFKIREVRDLNQNMGEIKLRAVHIIPDLIRDILLSGVVLQDGGVPGLGVDVGVDFGGEDGFVA